MWVSTLLVRSVAGGLARFLAGWGLVERGAT